MLKTPDWFQIDLAILTNCFRDLVCNLQVQKTGKLVPGYKPKWSLVLEKIIHLHNSLITCTGLNLDGMTPESFMITIPSIPAASSYRVTLQTPEGDTVNVTFAPEDLVQGMLSYTFDDLVPAESYTVSLIVIDENGNEVAVSSQDVTLPGKKKTKLKTTFNYSSKNM